MLHRSSLRHPLALIAAVAASALAATPVHAAPAPVPVPADAPTVATTPSGAAVIAFVLGGRTCTVLQEAGAPRPATLIEPEVAEARLGSVRENGACQGVRAQSRFHAEVLHSTADAGSRLAWGVAGAGVARLQIRDRSRTMSESAAAPAALPGPSGALRFWVLEQRDEDQADEVAVLDAAGTVRNAYATLLLGLGTFSSPYEIGAPSTKVLARGTAGDTRWRLLLESESRLTPTPLDPEHRVPLRCLAFATESARGGSSDFGGLCDRDVVESTALAVADGSSCDVGLHFEVLARSSVRSAEAILGDGSRRRIRLLALGGAYGARAGELIVGAGLAVRRIDGLGADGRVVDTWPVGAPPYRRDCGLSTSGSVIFSDPTASTTLGAPPHVVHVADRDDRLCLAIDRAPRMPMECAAPPTDPESAHVGSVSAGDGTYVYGIVPTEVAAARVHFADGTTRTVATTPIPGYTGQYAGVLGQVALDVPAGATARSAALLDAAGRVVGRSDLRTFHLSQGRTMTLRPASGGVPAFLATPFTVDFGDRHEIRTCIGFSVPKTVFDCGLDAFSAADTGARTLRVLSRCAPRRLVVTALLRHADDRLVVRTRAGHEVVARTVRIPAAAGGAAGHVLAVAVLNPREAIAGVRLRGGAARRIKAAYPAAASQCGYSDQPAFDDTPGFD